MSPATKRELKSSLSLAVPVILANLGAMLLGVVDTIVVGRLGSIELSGVAAAGNLFWPMIVLGLGFLFATDTLVSQSFGADNLRRAWRLLFQFSYACVPVSILLMFLVWGLTSIYPHTGSDPATVAIAVPFGKLLVWTTPAVMFFSLLQRFWAALHIVTPFTVIMVLGNVLNLFGNLALVFGKFGCPELGVMGSAWSTFWSRLFMLALAIGFTLWKRRRFFGEALKRQGRFLEHHAIDWKMQKQILKIGVPGAGAFGLEAGLFAFTTFLAGRLGALDLAAHHVTLQIATMTFMVPMGLSNAAAVRVGKHIGALRPASARLAGNLNIAIAVVFMAASGVVLLTFPSTILSWFVVDQEVIRRALSITVFAASFQIFDGIQVTAGGCLRGIGNTHAPFFVNLVGHYPLGAVIATVACFTFAQGLRGLWMGLTIGLLVVALSLLIIWIRTPDSRLRPQAV